MPVAIREPGKFEDVGNGADRLMLAPLRELLIEGNATGELAIPDVATTAIASLGTVNVVVMFELVQTGTLDIEKANRTLIPQLTQGSLPRQPAPPPLWDCAQEVLSQGEDYCLATAS